MLLALKSNRECVITEEDREIYSRDGFKIIETSQEEQASEQSGAEDLSPKKNVRKLK